VPDVLLPLLSAVPPWLLLAALLGVINAAACFLLVGRRATHLAWYAVIGALAAGVGQVVGTAVDVPAPLQIGEVNVAASSVAAWVVLVGARLAGL
jgi:hypothetical protein